MPRFSGLQLEVISLYRALLRAVRDKPQEARPAFMAEIRGQFKRNATVPRMDAMRIEFLIRRGRKQLEVVQSPHCQSVGRAAPSPAQPKGAP